MPVHGRAINPESARDGARVLAAVDELARMLRLRGCHRGLAVQLHAARLDHLQARADALDDEGALELGQRRSRERLACRSASWCRSIPTATGTGLSARGEAG